MQDAYAFPDLASAVRVVQLTDPHLFAEHDGRLLGVPTTASFQAVLSAVKIAADNRHFPFDFLLATGDLVQDHNPQAYHRFAEMVRPLAKPLFWLEGNHDTQPKMGETLSHYAQIQPHKQILVGNHWQILLLDSHIEGVPKGALSAQTLDWLASKLSVFSDRFTLIALHHNILPTGSAWLDQHSLANPEALAAVLAPFRSQIKGILHGHIHQAVDSEWQGFRILATPSTCIQFKPNCDEFTLDTQPPGWRELTLHPNGQLETTVKRLDFGSFLPDFAGKGY